MFGDYFRYPKTGGCALQIEVARDQENIFNFELCANMIIYFAVNNLVSSFLIISKGG